MGPSAALVETGVDGPCLIAARSSNSESGKKVETRIYEAGAGVNPWFCAEGYDTVREEAAARVLA